MNDVYECKNIRHAVEDLDYSYTNSDGDCYISFVWEETNSYPILNWDQ